MMTGLVSIIVPVYNSEETLRCCLQSIAEQSYSNLQIIVIDDGSNDSSAWVCDKFADLDKRFTVIHTKNNGVCSARNLGLSLCEGEFIAFVDSDDSIHPQMIEKMFLEATRLDADIVFCRVAFVGEGYLYKRTKSLELKAHTLSIDDFYRCVFSLKNFGDFGQNGGYLCNKLFRMRAIGKTRLSACKVAEDELFLVSIARNLRQIVFIDEVLYYYTVRKHSLSRQNSFTHDLVKARELCIEVSNNNFLVHKICHFGYAMALVWLFDELNREGAFLSIRHLSGRDDLRRRSRAVLVNLLFYAKLAGCYLSARDLSKLIFSSLPFFFQSVIYKMKVLL